MNVMTTGAKDGVMRESKCESVLDSVAKRNLCSTSHIAYINWMLLFIHLNLTRERFMDYLDNDRDGDLIFNKKGWKD